MSFLSGLASLLGTAERHVATNVTHPKNVVNALAGPIIGHNLIHSNGGMQLPPPNNPFSFWKEPMAAPIGQDASRQNQYNAGVGRYNTVMNNYILAHQNLPIRTQQPPFIGIRPSTSMQNSFDSPFTSPGVLQGAYRPLQGTYRPLQGNYQNIQGVGGVE